MPEKIIHGTHSMLLSWNFSYDFVKNCPVICGFFSSECIQEAKVGDIIHALFVTIFFLLVTGSSEEFFW